MVFQKAFFASNILDIKIGKIVSAFFFQQRDTVKFFHILVWIPGF